MTNTVIMTVMLSTNWQSAGLLTTNGLWLQGDVYRYTAFHTVDGKNRIPCGYTVGVKVGYINKTNDVLGPLVWTP